MIAHFLSSFYYWDIHYYLGKLQYENLSNIVAVRLEKLKGLLKDSEKVKGSEKAKDL